MSLGTKINIPKHLLSSCKHDKVRCELIAMSICIKCNYGDSLVKNINPTKLQGLLHCGYNKAKNLFQLAKTENDLFYYNPHTNSLLAKNFKRDYTNIDKDKYGKKRWSMYAVKIERKEYSLRELLSLFKESLFLCAINAKERRDEFRCKNKHTSFTSDITLTQKRLQRITGCKNRMAIYRLTKKLEQKNEINTERAKMIFVSNCISDDALKELHLSHTNLIICHRNGVAYTIMPNNYKIQNYGINKRFCNIIFNHSKRYYTYSKVDKTLSNEQSRIDAYFEQYVH